MTVSANDRGKSEVATKLSGGGTVTSQPSDFQKPGRNIRVESERYKVAPLRARHARYIFFSAVVFCAPLPGVRRFLLDVLVCGILILFSHVLDKRKSQAFRGVVEDHDNLD